MRITPPRHPAGAPNSAGGRFAPYSRSESTTSLVPALTPAPDWDEALESHQDPVWDGHNAPWTEDLGSAAHGGGQERNNASLPHIVQEDEMNSWKTPVAVAMGALVLLGGCTTDTPAPSVTESAEEVTPEPTPSPTESVTPEPEVPDVEVPEVGAFVTEDQAQAARDAGLGVFVTADGQLLVINPTQPLPDVVIQEFKDTGANGAGPDTSLGADQQGEDLKEIGRRTAEAGRIAVFVVSSGAYDGLERVAVSYVAYSTDYGIHSAIGAALVAHNPSADPNGGWTHDEALAAANAAVAASPDPSRVEVVDTTAW